MDNEGELCIYWSDEEPAPIAVVKFILRSCRKRYLPDSFSCVCYKWRAQMCQHKFCGNISAETNDDDIYNQDDGNYYDCDDDYEEKTKLSVEVKFRTCIFGRIGGGGEGGRGEFTLTESFAYLLNGWSGTQPI